MSRPSLSRTSFAWDLAQNHKFYVVLCLRKIQRCSVVFVCVDRENNEECHHDSRSPILCRDLHFCCACRPILSEGWGDISFLSGQEEKKKNLLNMWKAAWETLQVSLHGAISA